MVTISGAYSKANNSSRYNWGYFKNFASIVCSRESTYRTALDLSAFDLPVMGAAAFRNFKNFLEATLECSMGTLSVVTAPIVTTVVGKTVGKLILKKEMQKDSLNYLRFSMEELTKENGLEEGINRIRKEEPEDKEFVASLYSGAGQNNTAEKYIAQGRKIQEFCDNFNDPDENRKLIYKFKKATIIGESLIEGAWWGSAGILTRWFRKNILNEDRFTGTKGYISDSESAEIGESGELNTFQRIIGVLSMFVSPAINLFMFNKIEVAEQNGSLEKNRFLKTAREQLDMTHGIYPKLGLLFTYTTVPKWISNITLSQGWFERTERILKLSTVVTSWWLGHRLTNGTLAKKADAELSKKYSVPPGILIEPEYLDSKEKNESSYERLTKTFPEPARIQHVLHRTSDNEELQKEAEDQHAKCLYKGFALHSGLVWVINMGVNHITKIRAMNALES